MRQPSRSSTVPSDQRRREGRDVPRRPEGGPSGYSPACPACGRNRDPISTSWPPSRHRSPEVSVCTNAKGYMLDVCVPLQLLPLHLPRPRLRLRLQLLRPNLLRRPVLISKAGHPRCSLYGIRRGRRTVGPGWEGCVRTSMSSYSSLSSSSSPSLTYSGSSIGLAVFLDMSRFDFTV